MTKFNWHINNQNTKLYSLENKTKDVMCDACEFLSEQGIKYDVKFGASMIWVYNTKGTKIAYYPTTNRWAKYRNTGMPTKHYTSKSIEDFVSNWLERID